MQNALRHELAHSLAASQELLSYQGLLALGVSSLGSPVVFFVACFVCRAVMLEAWELLQRFFYMQGVDVFTPARWTKVGPSLRLWSAGLAIHGVVKEAYVRSAVLQAG